MKAHWKEGAIILSLLLVCVGFVVGLSLSKKANSLAIIKHHAEVLYRIELDKETDQRDIVIKGDHGDVVISVRKDEICVHESNCPSQFCVHEGWRKGGQPIVCAYNGISVIFEGDSGNTAILG